MATYDDLSGHPQVAANGMVAELQHATLGAMRMPGFPVDSAAANAQPHRAAPACGEHTEQVLREAGFGDAEIAALQTTHAVRCGDLEARA